MAMEFKPLLEYRRPADCWCCSTCETENDQSSPFCRLCGNQKNDRCFTLKKWSAAINSIPHRHIPPMSQPRTTSSHYSGGPSTRPDISDPYIPSSYTPAGSDSSSGNSNWATFWIIAVIIFVVIVICASAS